MPPLVPYQSRSQTPVPGPVAPMGDVFGGVERTLDLYSRIQEASDRAEAANLSQTATAGIEGAIRIADAEHPDPDEFKNKSVSDSQAIYQSTLQRARNPRVRQLTQDAMADNMIRASTAIQLGYKGKQIEFGKANMFEYGKGAQKELATLWDNPVREAEKEKEIFDRFEDAVKTGILKPIEGRIALEKIHKEKDKEAAGYLLMKDPVRLLKELDAGRFPNLEQSERYQLEQHSIERIREGRIEAERLQKERVATKEKELVIELDKSTTDLTAMRSRIMNDPTIPADTSLKWMRIINSAIEQKNKTGIDPVKHSDPAVLAHVAKGVLENPEQWSPSDVTRYIGRGLSVQDAKTWTHELEQKQKGDDKKTDAQKQFIRSWEFHVSDGSFLPPEKQKPQRQLSLTDQQTNERNAKRVYDEVMRRSSGPNGEDPAVVFNELMQPYHDIKVKSWFDRQVRGALSQLGIESEPEYYATREDVVAARQLVIKSKQDPENPELIRKALEFLRKKRTPAKASTAPQAEY